MNTHRKLLFDCENLQGIPGISVSDYEIVLSGKVFNCISKNEESQEIYHAIRRNCDISFFSEIRAEELNFYPVPMVCIFAFDNFGNCFGTLNGITSIEDNGNEMPVVYINKMSGVYGKIADNMKSFFALANYYPYWRRIIEHEQNKTLYNLREIEGQDLYDELYFKTQREIGESLNLSRDSNAVNNLIENIRSYSELTVYKSKEEAEMKNEFIVL